MKKLAATITVFAIAISGSCLAHTHHLYDVHQSPFAAFIAQRTGDILTVIVDEKATATDDGTRELSKDSSLFATIKDFFLPPFDIQKGFTRTKGSGDAPKIDFSSKSSFKGDASNTSEHEIDTRLQVRMIEEVRPGEFVIRGKRVVNIHGKSKVIYISGVVRQRDIAKDNTVKSHQLADATIEIEGEVVKKDLRPGIFHSIFNKIF